MRARNIICCSHAVYFGILRFWPCRGYLAKPILDIATVYHFWKIKIWISSPSIPSMRQWDQHFNRASLTLITLCTSTHLALETPSALRRHFYNPTPLFDAYSFHSYLSILKQSFSIFKTTLAQPLPFCNPVGSFVPAHSQSSSQHVFRHRTVVMYPRLVPY